MRYIFPRDPSARRAAIRFFAPGLHKRFRMELLIAHTAVRTREFRCGTTLVERIMSEVGISEASYAVVNGTPGPWTKSTLLVMDKSNRPCAVVKVGTTEAARILIKNEAVWLNRLAECRDVSAMVPRCLLFSTSEDVTWLAQEPLAGKIDARVPGNYEVAFLRALQSGMPTSSGFSNSNMHREMKNRMESFGTKMNLDWRERAELALDRITVLMPGDLRMTVAHRDFAPWNMRIGPTGVRVFDWEYARSGYLPLYDLFHFHLMPVAVRSSLTKHHIAAAIDTVFRSSIGDAPPVLPDVQCLAYLLDVCLMYIDSNGGDSNGVVVERYSNLIDQFPQWSRR